MAAKKRAAQAAAPSTGIGAASADEELEMEDTNDIPTPKGAPEITARMIKDANEAGLGDRPSSKTSPEKRALWDTYVRFITQSPEKWEIEKEELLRKLDVMK